MPSTIVSLAYFLLLLQLSSLAALLRLRREKQQRLVSLKREIVCWYIKTQLENAGRFVPRSKLLSRNWYHDHLLKMQPDHFRTELRLWPWSVDRLVQRLEPFLPLNYDGPGQTPLDVKHQLCIFLSRCANNTSCRVTGSRFGVSESSVKRVTTRVARAIPHALCGFIRWPTPEQFLNENVPAFNAKGPIKGIGLALDGTYVVLERAPSFRFDPKAYFNHKLRYAVQVQAACDHRRRFLDITAGWPGSVHDARVFANSYLGQNLERLLPPGYVLSQRVAHFTRHFRVKAVADSAFSLSPALWVPFVGGVALEPHEEKWNTAVAAPRSEIEHLYVALLLCVVLSSCRFGVWKNRFPILRCCPLRHPKAVTELAIALAFVHNFLEEENDAWTARDEAEEDFSVPIYDNHADVAALRERLARGLP